VTSWGCATGICRRVTASSVSFPYAPEVIQRIACHDAQAHPVSCAPELASPLRIDCTCAAVSALTSSGDWSQTPYGTKNVPKTEAQTPIRSWLSHERVKRLGAWTDARAQPLTQDLELVPLENPLALASGNKLDLMVSRAGRATRAARPRGGARVARGAGPWSRVWRCG
jgi:nickel transport protein